MFDVYFNGLILGLGASLHCLGMCGPLVMAVPMKSNNVYDRAWGIAQYHIGKTTTYALLGLLIGIVGISLKTFQWMQILSVVSGILIILFAWAKFVRIPFGKSALQKFTQFSGITINKLFKSNLPFKPLFFGSINGLLPCGLVYIALINSILAGSPFQSMLAMVFFGLGTVPILTFARVISQRLKWKTNRWTPVLVTFVGVMIVLRGLNLGIPYISPKIDTQIVSDISGKTEKKEVVMSCCSSKEKCEEVK